MIVAQLGAGILDTAGAAFKQAYPEYGTAIDAGVKVGNAVTGSGKTSVPAGPQATIQHTTFEKAIAQTPGYTQECGRYAYYQRQKNVPAATLEKARKECEAAKKFSAAGRKFLAQGGVPSSSGFQITLGVGVAAVIALAAGAALILR